MQLLKSVWNKIPDWDVYVYFCFLSFFLMQRTTENFWITKLATREKKWTHEIPTRKNFESTKYQLQNILHPQNNHWKIFGPKKYPRDKILDPKNIHKKNFAPTKYPREKISNPRNTYEGRMTRWYETHDIHNDTRPTKFSILPQMTSLANRFCCCCSCFCCCCCCWYSLLRPQSSDTWHTL